MFRKSESESNSGRDFNYFIESNIFIAEGSIGVRCELGEISLWYVVKHSFQAGKVAIVSKGAG